MIRAHQVIADLIRYEIAYSRNEPCKADFKGICRNIKNSHKFLFGKYGEMTKMFTIKGLGDRLFLDEVDDLIFPYDLCWFEYGSSKYNDVHWAVLTEYDHKDRFFVAMFFGRSPRSTEGVWRLEPWGARVNIGRKNDGEKGNVQIAEFWNTGKDIIDVPMTEINEVIRGHIYFLVMALKLLNCNNIGTVYQDAPLKLKKKRARAGKPPLFRYQTLILKPVGKRQRSLEAQGLWEQCIHFHKGGFRYYPPPGLFGKYPGRYWFQSHQRGKKKKGVLIKDYDARELINEAKTPTRL